MRCRPLDIDVGGFVYRTTHATLCRSPTIKRMLEALPEDELLFIDRDGVAFSHILNFLRTGSPMRVHDAAYAQFLVAEAGYFQLHSMAAQLRTMCESSTVEAERVLAAVRAIARSVSHDPAGLGAGVV